MIYGLYHSAAGMMTNEYRQAVLANNVANSETVGFKRDVPTFAERVPARLAGVRHGPSAEDMQGLSGGLWLGRTWTDFSEGPKVRTDSPYDVALDGPGFLAVQVDGQVQYTRDGRLAKTPDGVLVAATDGAPVLGRGGTLVRLNPLGGEIQVGTEGRVTQDGVVVGELELTDFADYAVLRKVGAQRFVPPENAECYRAPVLVLQRYTESAAVEPIQELVSMIEASRAYQLNARMVSMQDESVGRLISTLLRP